MTKKQAIELMQSSSNNQEWDLNCDKVKKAFNGYPSWWNSEIIMSGIQRGELNISGITKFPTK